MKTEMLHRVLHISAMLTSGAALTVIALIAAGQGVQDPFAHAPSVAVRMGCTALMFAGLFAGFLHSQAGGVLVFSGLLGAAANQFGSNGSLPGSDLLLLSIPMVLLFADAAFNKRSSNDKGGNSPFQSARMQQQFAHTLQHRTAHYTTPKLRARALNSSAA
jgi:hypothetical protein